MALARFWPPNHVACSDRRSGIMWIHARFGLSSTRGMATGESLVLLHLHEDNSSWLSVLSSSDQFMLHWHPLPLALLHGSSRSPHQTRAGWWIIRRTPLSSLHFSSRALQIEQERSPRKSSPMSRILSSHGRWPGLSMR